MNTTAKEYLNQFQYKNNPILLGLYNWNSKAEIYSASQNSTSANIGSFNGIDNISQTMSICKSLQLGIISIERPKNSTLIKFINEKTILVLTFNPLEISLSNARAFMTKFNIQYRTA